MKNTTSRRELLTASAIAASTVAMPTIVKGAVPPPLARAIYASWYDLPQDIAGDHLRWLQSSWLPDLSRRADLSWVAHYQVVGGSPAFQAGARTRLARLDDPAMPKGSQFLLLFGADSPWTFFGPDSFWRGDQSQTTRTRLAERVGERVSIFTVEQSINGPARASSPGLGPSAAIQMGSFVMKSPAAEFGLGEFYAQRRGPMMQKLPGCIRMTKLVTVAGWGRHAVLYEFESLEARLKQFEPAEFGDSTPGQPHAGDIGRTIHLPGSPSVAARTFPSA